jgi:hypothetical protein
VRPGDLVLIDVPEGIRDLPLYSTWHGQLALVVEESPILTVHRSWRVLVNGIIRDIGENHLHRIYEEVG